eukprot:scaffold4545_cov103-Alexandrium_tamarense.AAC.10
MLPRLIYHRVRRTTFQLAFEEATDATDQRWPLRVCCDVSENGVLLANEDEPNLALTHNHSLLHQLSPPFTSVVGREEKFRGLAPWALFCHPRPLPSLQR